MYFHMITIVLDGECGEHFEKKLTELLQTSGRVTTVGGRSLKGRGDMDFLLIHSDSLTELDSSGLLIFFGNAEYRQMRVGSGMVAVTDMTNETALGILKDIDIIVITCSMSGRSTLSMASLTDDSAVVSLQREIHSLSGRIIEPHDITVKLTVPMGDYQVMALCAAVLLCDISRGDSYEF